MRISDHFEKLSLPKVRAKVTKQMPKTVVFCYEQGLKFGSESNDFPAPVQNYLNQAWNLNEI